MNTAYRVVWNESTNTWAAVSEIASARTKGGKSGKAGKVRTLAIAAAAVVGAFSAPVDAFIAQGGGTAGSDGGVATNTAINGGNATAVGGFAVAIGGAATASADNAIALGAGATASGSASMAFGQFSSATGYGSTAFGPGAHAEGKSSSAFGMGAGAQGDYSTAIGWGSSATSAKSFAIGGYATASGGEGALALGLIANASATNATAIGTNAAASGSAATAIGLNAIASGSSATAVGASALAYSSNALSIGTLATVTGDTATAIGWSANASGDRSVAIGKATSATNDNAIALGNVATASGSGAFALGHAATALADNSVALGKSAVATTANAIAFGSQTTAAGQSAVAFGQTAKAATDNSIAMGTNASAGSGTATNAVAIGMTALATGGNALALGSGAQAKTINSIAIGQGAQVTTATYASALGSNASAGGDWSTVMGGNATATGNWSTALGSKATSVAGTSVALGANAIADRTGMSGKVEMFSSTTVASSAGAVSVGSAGGERQVINVAGGTQDTDAVNVRQLKAGNQAIADLIGGTTTINANGDVAGPFITLAGTTYNTVADAITNIYATGSKYFHANSTLADSSAVGTDSIAVGPQAVTKGVNAIAIGLAATALGGSSVALGYKATNTASDAVAIGSSSSATASEAVAIGHGAQAVYNNVSGTGAGLIAMGASAYATGTDSIAIGRGAYANPSISGVPGLIAIGLGASATYGRNIAIGESAVALGGAYDGGFAVALGTSATAIGGGGMWGQGTAIGSRSYVSSGGGVALGYSASVTGTESIASGFRASAGGGYSVAVGSSTAGLNQSSVAVGARATVSADYGIAVGKAAVVTGVRGVALGGGSAATGSNGVAVGWSASAAVGGTTVGAYAKAQANNGLALGNSASALLDSTVALGANSIADRAGMNGVAELFSGASVSSTAGAVSVGNSGAERQITNVAGGTQDTDAVNVRQLKASNQQVVDVIGGDTYIDNSTGAVTGPFITLNGDTYDTVGDAITNIYEKGNKYFHANSTLPDSQAIGQNSIAVGPNAIANSNNSIAMGNNARDVFGVNSVVIGNNAVVDVKQGGWSSGIAVGDGAQTTVNYGTAIGAGAKVDKGASVADNFGGGVALGLRAHAANTYSEAVTDYTSSTAVGSDAQADGASTSIGELAVANTLRGVAVGANSTVTGDYGSVLGSEAQAGLNATALGHAARASSDNSVALGADSVADGSASDLSKAGYSIDGSAVAGNAMGEVSVGSAGSERRITNVAAGLSDTDAVNVSQLKVTDAAVSSIDGRVTTIEGDITSINSVLDGVVKYDRNGDGSVNYDSITLGGGADGTKITNVAAGDVSETSKDAINGSQLWAVDQSITSLGTTVTNLTTNIENGTIGPVQRTGTDQLSLIAAGGDAATPGAAQVLTNVADGAINTSSLDAINGSQLYALASSTANALGGDSTVNADGTVTAPTYVVDGSTVNNVGAAITAIDSVLAATVRYDDASHDTITLGGADGTQIKNVAAGVADTDAVNVGQLNALGDQVTSIDGRVSTVEGDVTSINTQIGDINNSITSIDGRVSNVEGSITTINTNIANLGDQVTSIDSRVTTLEGGWNVADEGGAGGAIKAGDVLTFKGDGSNTTVTYDDATKQMTVALEKDITVDSVTAGNTVMDTNGVTIVGGPSMTTAGIDAASMKIVNVAAGTASTDAVNVSQLQGVTNIIGGDTYIDSSTGAVTGPFITIGGDTYNTVADAIEGVDQGAVKYDRNGDGSVNYDSITLAGGADGTKITNVAAGDVSETSKDAINGSQLWAVQQDISTLGDTPMTFVGNSGSVDKKLGETFSIEGDALTAGMYSGANVKTEVDANGRLQIQIADNPAFTSVITGDTVMSDSGLTIASGPSITKTGIDAGSMKIANVAAGADDTDAVNVSQLKAVADATGNLSDRAVQYDLNTDGTANYNTVTLAGTDGTQIKNVADGVDAHDAVNVGQLSSGGDIYNTLTTDITNNVHNVYGDTLRYFKADGANDGTDDAQVVAGTNSAAIGANSVADRANTVSVGSVGNERQIVNVAAGTQDTDAVNVSQLKGVTNIIGGDTYIDASTGEVKGPFITIGGDTYTTVADAITHIDGRVTNIEGNITSITGVLDGVVVYDRNSDDTVNHDTITLDGANGTQIKNVADGVDAHDAVNVGQLSVGGDIYNTLTSDITNNVHNVYGDTLRYFKADGANDGTDDAQIVAGTNSAAIGANSVADRANTVSVGSAGNERQIVNVAAGTQDTDAVNVSQLKGIADVIGGGTTINNDGSITNPTFVINGGDTYTTVADAITNIDGRVTTLEGDITNINNGGGIKYFHANSTLADAVASGTNSVAVGPQAVASGTDAVAIGNNAQAAADNSVALGANSKTADAVSTASGTVGGTRYTYAGGTAAGTVSVGDAGAERTLTNVAAGRVSADSTDAVNGSQLYATNQAIETLSGTVSNIDARVTNLEGSVTNINGDIANIYNELGNQLVKQDADTRTLTVGAATDGKVINVSGTAGDRTITGLAAGVADNDAVNVSQLKGVQEQVTNIYNTGSKYFQANSTLEAAQAKGADSVAIGGNAQATADNSVAIGSNAVADRANTVSVGAAGNERQITNVAEGTQGTDAVNVNQLNNAVGNATNNFNQQIGEVNNRIDDVDKTARRGIAAAAALQIVTPYLPGRTVVNAGVANYRGAGAVGVGVSRWNEKGTVNYNAGVSTSTGGAKDTIFRAGVGFVLGD